MTMQIDNGDIVKKKFIRDKYIRNSDSVLDLFCGSGLMYRTCYVDAARYTGVDLKGGHNSDCVKSDNISFLRNAKEFHYTFVDIDAYGSCAKQFRVVLETASKFGVNNLRIVFTDGGRIDTQRRHRLLDELARNEGVDNNADLFCAYYVYFDVLKKFFRNTAERNGYSIEDFLMCYKDKKQVAYGGMVISR